MNPVIHAKKSKPLLYSLQVILLAILLAVLFAFFSKFTFSVIYESRPTAFSNSGGAGFAVNESHAFDSNTSSFTVLFLATGDLNYSAFNSSGHSDSEAIVRVDLGFDIEVVGTTNDQWALHYSNDNGSTWIELRALGTGDLGRQILWYQSIANAGNSQWRWTNISSSFQMRLQTDSQGAPDGAELRLYETYLNVTVDNDSPQISLNSPGDIANLTNSTVFFSYAANDSLSGIWNCSLHVNSTLNLTNSTVSNGQLNNFTQDFADGLYSWNITCYDNSSAFNGNTSQTRNFLLDTTPPYISLMHPADNLIINDSALVNFTYNVSELSQLMNCSLIINGTLNQTNYSVSTFARQAFRAVLDRGAYSWAVNCTDARLFYNISQTYNLTINYTRHPQTIDSFSIPSPFDLYAGRFRELNCTARVIDNNTVAEIAFANGTIFHSSSSSLSSPDSNQTHYTANLCSCSPSSGNEANCTCSFPVWYVAMNGTWNCSVTVASTDGLDLVSSQENFTINPIYAINVSNGIDFGNVAGMGISANTTALVTSIGNQPINVSVIGYGAAIGDGIGMACSSGQNLSLGAIKFSTNPDDGFASKTPLDGSLQSLFGLTVQNPSEVGALFPNSTYWQAQAPPSSFGECFGNVVFVAGRAS